MFLPTSPASAPSVATSSFLLSLLPFFLRYFVNFSLSIPPAGEKPLVCSFCNYDFSSHGSLSAHLRSVHKRKPFHCSSCAVGFNTQGALTKHLGTHGLTAVLIETLDAP